MKIKILILFLITPFFIKAQCGATIACNPNAGIFSNDNAATIAYDNIGSGYHSTFILEANGVWKVWGDFMNNGNSPALSPLAFNATNFPALTGTIYKMTLGSRAFLQHIVLTSTGLFALGNEGSVIDERITSSTTFQKLTIDGKTDGLPIDVSPDNVKMMFASYQKLIITTCAGFVYELKNQGTSTKWQQVMINPTTPLTDVIVTRGQNGVGFALKSDGTLWTWGNGVYIGNGTSFQNLSYATQMQLPAGMPAVKMIQMTQLSGAYNSYYVLGTDKKVYALGRNYYGQLGDKTTVDRLTWVNARNPNNTIIDDALWISANEHDNLNATFTIIKNGGVFFTTGYNSFEMIGNSSNFLKIPNGIVASDKITFAEAGGHTTMVIKEGSPRYGYVGHRVAGSLGDGTATDENLPSFNFILPPVVNICGSTCVSPTVSAVSPICIGESAIFKIQGINGDVISYTINGGSTQTVTTDATGYATISVPNVQSTQNIVLTNLTNLYSTCSLTLNISASVQVNTTVATIPTFTAVAPICSDLILSPLPVTSTNGIVGSWTPPINNSATTTYTFTPNSGQCAASVSMTIVVSTTKPTFTPIAPICNGTTLSPLPTTSTNGIVGSWSPPLNNTATTTYTFSPNSGQCATSATMTIIVGSTIPTFTQVAPVCSGATLSPLPTTSTNGIVGSWSPPLNNTATTTYTFTPNSGQCATSATMTIVVTPKINPIFTQVTPICSGATILPLPTTSNNGIIGSWSPALNNTATTTYTFTPNTNQCATTASMTIVVTPKINPTFTQVTPICSGATILPLPTTSINGIVGSWSPPLNNTATTTYTFSPNSGQCATSATMTIVVTPKINPIFTQVTPICSGATILPLPTTSNNGIIGSWSPALNNTATTTYTFTPNTNQCVTTASMTIVVAPKINPTFTQVTPICSGATIIPLPTTSNNGIAGSWSPTLNNTATTTYTFTPNTNQCATTASMTIVVTPRTTPVFNNFGQICYGANFQLPLTSNNNITGTWTPQFNNTVSGTYTFTPNSNFCSNTISVSVSIKPEIDFDFRKYCADEQFFIEAYPINNSFNQDKAVYQWFFDNNLITNKSNVLNLTAYKNSTSANEEFPNHIKIKITDEFGCEKSKDLIITNDYCKIQKGISVDGNDQNDYFDLRLLNVKHLSIFNRYGTKVYEQGSYKDEWHGQTNKGEMLPTGVYFYVIEYNDAIEDKTGWIYVLTQ